MPRYAKRKYAAKPAARKPRRATKATKVKRVRKVRSQNATTRLEQCVWSADIQPTSEGIFSGTAGLALHFNPFDPVSGYKQTAQWAVYSNLYDQYRITGMHVKLTPTFNNTSIGDLLSVSANAALMVYSALDRDSPVAMSIKAMEGLTSMHRNRIDQVITKGVSYKYPGTMWLDCQKTETSTDILKDIGLMTDVGVFATGLPTTLLTRTVYRCEIAYWIVFKGENLNAAVKLEGGGVKLLNTQETEPYINYNTNHFVNSTSIATVAE